MTELEVWSTGLFSSLSPSSHGGEKCQGTVSQILTSLHVGTHILPHVGVLGGDLQSSPHLSLEHVSKGGLVLKKQEAPHF